MTSILFIGVDKENLLEFPNHLLYTTYTLYLFAYIYICPVHHFLTYSSILGLFFFFKNQQFITQST